MTRTAFRFVPFTIVQDPDTEPTYRAWCVSGDEEECGQDSGEWITPHPVEVWMDAHVRRTGHLNYRRAFYDNAVYDAPDAPRPEEVPDHP